MSSLTTLCIEKIAEQIEQSPPMIQEMIINDTSEHIKKKALKESIKQMSILPSLVASISKAIILSRSRFESSPNFYEIYITIPQEIVKLAIDISEMNIYELDKSFNILSSVSASSRYRHYQTESDTDNSDDDEENEMYNFHIENDTDTE